VGAAGSYKCLIQPMIRSDEPFLWEMLYQAIYVPPNAVAPPRQIVRSSELARYVQGWGQAGDYGLKALRPDDLQPIGAVWLRLLTGENRGYGYVDDFTPELSIAAESGWRGKGVGTLLLTELFACVRERYKAVSLSVSEDNPALSLYKRLGFETVGQEGTSIKMKKDFTTCAADGYALEVK